MIHVVTLANQHLYPAQLDQMFRMRHAFYVEGHRWAGLVSKDGREVDEFDNDEAVYLMSIDPWGDLASCVRINPTTGPTLLAKFRDWSDEPLPAGEDIWDISRWIAAPVHRRGHNPRWPSNHQRELMLGLLEFGLARGLSRFTLLAEQRLAERIAAYGWPLRNLGAPREYENGKGVAVAAEIRAGFDVLAMTRARTGISSPVLFEAAPSQAATARSIEPESELVSLIRDIGAPALDRLLKATAKEIAAGYGADTSRAIELLVQFRRLVEAAGVELSADAPPMSQAPLAAPGDSATAGAMPRTPSAS